MRVKFNNNTYYVPYGRAVCDTCPEWYECAAHNDRWHQCRCFDDGNQSDMKKPCPHMEQIMPRATDYKQYKATYINTPDGRKVEVKPV